MNMKRDEKRLPAIPAAPPPRNRTRRLFDAAMKILYGQCPEEPAVYLCRKAEEFDEEICVRCWTREIFRALNGE